LDDSDVQNLEKGLKNEKVPLKTDDEVVEREEQAINPDGYSVAEQKLMKSLAEQHHFQAEVSELMNIIINSLYSNKDVFLRELISNASDALDKIRFVSLTDPDQLGNGEQSKLHIHIKADQEHKVLHISDTGIGMTKDELINNLGRIAKSGTREFVQKIHETGGDPNSLIGQFGVGFYSAFLVADKVVVTSKNNSDKQYVWESNAKDSFSVTEDPHGPTLGRGTRISLYLKEEQFGYLDQSKLENLIRKYSEFINFPIFLWASRTEEKEVEAEEPEESEEPDLDETEEEEEEEKPKKKTVKETVWEWNRMNKNKPIWQRNSSEITEDEYNEFYKSLSKDYRDPLAYIHFSGEGEIEFKSILYIPAAAPENMFDTAKTTQNNIKLYVRRVFITDEFSDLTPKWMSFVKGVVDSADLPLNVSREILQQNKSLETIKKKLIRKAIAMFQQLADDAEKSEEAKAKWDQFYNNYSTNLKLGVIEDRINKHRLSKLLRFHSSKVDKLTSLDDYVSRMKEKQEQIYYIGGQDVDTLAGSPLVERLLKRGYEVLYLIEPIDEYLAPGIGSYDGKYPMVNVGREGLKLEADQEDEEKLNEQFKDVVDFLKAHHSGKLEKVVISNRLTKSPSALVSNSWGYTANMERIVRAQALGDSKSSNLSKTAKKVMEINPRHPIIKELNQRIQADPEDPVAKDTADLLYDTAALHSRFSLDEPSKFAERIHRMMKLSLQIPIDAEADEAPEPEEKPQEEQAEQVDEEWNDEEEHAEL